MCHKAAAALLFTGTEMVVIDYVDLRSCCLFCPESGEHPFSLLMLHRAKFIPKLAGFDVVKTQVNVLSASAIISGTIQLHGHGASVYPFQIFDGNAIDILEIPVPWKHEERLVNDGLKMNGHAAFGLAGEGIVFWRNKHGNILGRVLRYPEMHLLKIRILAVADHVSVLEGFGQVSGIG